MVPNTGGAVMKFAVAHGQKDKKGDAMGFK